MGDFDMNLDELHDEFSFDEVNENKHDTLSKQKEITNAREYKAKVKYAELITTRAASFNEIVSMDLKENVQYRIVTSMSFNAITVIQYLLDYYQITEMSLAIYRMNNKSFDYLKEFIQKDNIPANILVSIFFNNNKKYERWAHALKAFGNTQENTTVGYGNCHCKVFVCKTKCGKYIIFEGSGNLSHNERLEQYVYENNKQAYDFHKSWIEEEIKMMKTDG